MESTAPTKLRDVGLIEQYCTHRHHLNYYTCVVTSAFYVRRIASYTDKLDIKQLVYRALHKLVPRHAMLSVGIQGEDSSSPYFFAHDKVDLELVVHLHEEELDLDDVVQRELGSHFKEVMSQNGPCWRVVVTPGTVDNVKGFWITWSFHHAIADGTGSKVFHRELLHLMNTENMDSGPAVSAVIDLTIPDPKAPKTKLPPAMEAVHKLPLGLRYILKAVVDEYLPFNRPDGTLWSCGAAGKPEYVGPPVGKPGLQTELLTLRVPREVMEGVLHQCRSRGISITALLEALLSFSLLEVFPKSGKVRVCVIVSMRRWLEDQLNAYGGADNVIANYVSQFPEDFIRASFAVGDPLPGIWNEAKRARETINRVLHESGKNTESGLLRFVGNFDSFFKGKIGQPRADSLEVSNIGVFKSTVSETSGSWHIREVRFSQSASVTGAAVACSVVSVERGAMCMGFTWQEGLVTKLEMREVLERTQSLLEAIHNAQGIILVDCS